MNNGFFPKTSKNRVSLFFTPCTSIYHTILASVIVASPVVYSTKELVHIFLLIGKPSDQVQPKTRRIKPVINNPAISLKCASCVLGTPDQSHSTSPLRLMKDPIR